MQLQLQQQQHHNDQDNHNDDDGALKRTKRRKRYKRSRCTFKVLQALEKHPLWMPRGGKQNSVLWIVIRIGIGGQELQLWQVAAGAGN